jgi:hypothetical protein
MIWILRAMIRRAAGLDVTDVLMQSNLDDILTLLKVML